MARRLLASHGLCCCHGVAYRLLPWHGSETVAMTWRGGCRHRIPYAVVMAWLTGFRHGIAHRLSQWLGGCRHDSEDVGIAWLVG